MPQKKAKFGLRFTFLSLLTPTLLFGAVKQSFAALTVKNPYDKTAPSILKADEVNGDRINNSLVATGNVEITKGNSVVFADKVTYAKTSGDINIIGKLRAKNIEVGNLTASGGVLKEDLSSGEFLNAKMIFSDGSYLDSPLVERKSEIVTILKTPIFSICPNPDISEDNSKAGVIRDFASIKSKFTTIDRQEEVIRSKGAIFRIYDVPFFYMPYLSVGLPSKKRKSGFLTPSYSRTTNLGLGIKIPYYFDISPNKDLVVEPLITLNNQILVNNKFRHLTDYGRYNVNFEIANNEITRRNDSNVINRTDKFLRWNLESKGAFDFTHNTGLDFDTNLVSDRDYLRDYHFSFLNYSVSKVNFDYINKRDYHSIKLINIQELENYESKRSAPKIIPIDSYIESKPFFSKEKFTFASNMTTIIREEGTQYRRLSVTPGLVLPFNLNGNLFEVDAKVQNDFYYVENSEFSNSNSQPYSTTAINQKPELSLNWKLPLLKKTKKSTLVVEPMANIVISSFKRSNSQIINEDSNDSELTVSNLFVSDRISGYDRNEAGRRINYGVKTSLYNDYGDFALTLGQGIKRGGDQDVSIRGFGSNDKSDFVGQANYKAVKYFNLAYSFQLNQSNFRNEINQIYSSLDFDRYGFGSNYLLIRRNQQNTSERRQISLNSFFKIDKLWKAKIVFNKDLVTNRTLSRSLILERDGCCTNFMFSVAETNPSTLSKPQKSFNISLQFKNL